MRRVTRAPLYCTEARLHRACAARTSCSALCRVDVAFAAKELCRKAALSSLGGLGGPPVAGTVLRGSPLSLKFCMAAGGSTSRLCGYGLRWVP